MKKRIVAMFLAVGLTGITTSASADSVIHLWECQLNEGKTVAELTEASSEWLEQAKKATAGDEIEAYTEYRIAAEGSNYSFNFVVVAPDLATWAAWYGDEDAEEKMADADEKWNEVATCHSSSLWYSTEVE